MTPLERADRAKLLLNDPVLREAFSAVREKIVSRTEQSAFGDVDTHHHAAQMLQALAQVRTELQIWTNEIAIDKRRQKDAAWIERMRERLT